MSEIEKGPWFGANYPGKCSTCEDRFDEGDRIRADGQGGWECEDCEESTYETYTKPRLQEQQVSMPAPYSLSDAMAASGLMDADEFLFQDPTPPVKVTDTPNVSGQPDARRDWLGRYIVIDPATGDFRRTKAGKPMGITRATTFNKAASDKGNIADWNKRNVLIGAALRPDLVTRAHGMTHDTHKDELNKLAAQLEEAAGSKVSANIGTELHAFTELMDAGQATWRDAPPAYQRQLALYAQTLADAGLEPVPGLIERTTMITEFDGVVGTFDRVFFHRASGQYIVGDLKTGQTMQYAMNETETQLWIYAHGVNQNGVYDWNTDAWEEPHTLENIYQRLAVSETVGVIIHMPVKGKDAGRVMLVHADLTAGRTHAELCHANRSKPKSKVKPFDASLTWLSWEDRFKAVRNGAEAGKLWEQARRTGMDPMELQRLVVLAQNAIRVQG